MTKMLDVMNLNASTKKGMFLPNRFQSCGTDSVILLSVRVSSDTFAHKSVQARLQCFCCLVLRGRATERDFFLSR